MAHNILLSVTGMTPQVVTETLYGIYKSDVANFPEEIYIITTITGAKKVKEKLVGEQGKIAEFCKTYHLPMIDFTEEKHLKIIADENGSAIDDARTPYEQEIIADYIFKQVRALTERKGNNDAPYYRIHASIAGGRKTMTYLLGSAMTILGNDDDVMSHVLVQQEYESLPDFYFPTIERSLVKNRDGIELDASIAKVELSEIPLIRMKLLTKDNKHFSIDHSYNETVASINRSLAIRPSELKLELKSCEYKLIINDEYEVQLKPLTFAIYRMLLENLKKPNLYKKPSNIGAAKKLYVSMFKYCPIANKQLKRQLDDFIDDLVEPTNRTLEQNIDYDIYSTLAEKANCLIQQDQKERGLKYQKMLSSSDDADDRNYFIQHPYILNKEKGRYLPNDDYLSKMQNFLQSHIKDINKKIKEVIPNDELPPYYILAADNGKSSGHNIPIRIENITIDGKSFLDE